MRYQQAAPELANQFETDRVLKSYLTRQLPEGVYRAIEGELDDLGAAAAGPWYALQQSDLGEEPTLTRWGAWGARLDAIEVTRVWQQARDEAARRGLVATAYEQRHGAHSRVHQMALAYLFIPSTDMYGCPLAMTDGAARTLLASGHADLIDRALPHLTSRDPGDAWTSGQWMTELAGGSDVGRARTTACQGDDGTWRLYGRKWFTSAITADMALALARPEGNPDGGRGLALFYVPLRDADGALRPGLHVERLKDKLGTRKLPTAELLLDGVEAVPVGDLAHGTRQVAPMLNVTRTWNAVTAVAFMRRGLALARDYAEKREAFGGTLAERPLHLDTLADLQATFEGAFHLTFRVVDLLGQDEAGTLDEAGQAALRLLTPLAKLTTGRQVTRVMSEVIEAFGGAGYVEDTGLPALLRDAQVLPIWEGTTNVLALDTLRALRTIGTLEPLHDEFRRCIEGVTSPTLADALRAAVGAYRRACRWLQRTMQAEDAADALEAGARRFALTVGRALELALLVRHAQWSLDHEQDGRAAAAAERLLHRRTDAMADLDPHAAYVLFWDFNCPTLFECHRGDGAAPAMDLSAFMGAPEAAAQAAEAEGDAPTPEAATTAAA